MPWSKPKSGQLELLDADSEQPRESCRDEKPPSTRQPEPTRASKPAAGGEVARAGRPLLVPLDRLIEDPNNPRTEFPEAEIDELAESIRQHGILQPWSYVLLTRPGTTASTTAPSAVAPRGRLA
jgi:ParB-like nuclease domain